MDEYCLIRFRFPGFPKDRLKMLEVISFDESCFLEDERDYGIVGVGTEPLFRREEKVGDRYQRRPGR